MPGVESKVTSPNLDPGLLAGVYDELRRRARQAMRHLPPGQTIQPTGLVHEAYANLVAREAGPFDDERHFLAVATLAIRSAIVDRVRAKNRIKRGGDRERLLLDDDLPIATPNAPDDVVLQVDELLEQLRDRDERAAEVVTLRFFLGMSESECAASLGIAERTVRRDWTFARTWLAARLTPETLSDA